MQNGLSSRSSHSAFFCKSSIFQISLHFVVRFLILEKSPFHEYLAASYAAVLFSESLNKVFRKMCKNSSNSEKNA